MKKKDKYLKGKIPRSKKKLFKVPYVQITRGNGEKGTKVNIRTISYKSGQGCRTEAPFLHLKLDKKSIC